MINGNSYDSASAQRSDDRRLLAELVETYISGGKLRPLLPTGRRNEILALLTGLMADRDRFDAYIAGLNSELEHHHVRLHLLQQGGADLDLPAEAIAREGFGSVSDDQLADIALSPEALEAIQEHLDDPETEEGEWLTKAISAVEEARPDAAERAEAARQVYVRLRNAGLLEAGPPSTLPLDQSARSKRLHLPRWLGQSLGLAASLLLGFVLGTQIRTSTEGREVVLGRVGVRGDITRGAQDVTLDVTNRGDRRAFITVVGLVPGRRSAAFHYRLGDRYIDVPAHETATVKNLPPEFEGATVAIVVLSDVPAGESVRLSLPSQLSPDRAGELAERIRQELGSLNIHAQLQTVPLAGGKQ